MQFEQGQNECIYEQVVGILTCENEVVSQYYCAIVHSVCSGLLGPWSEMGHFMTKGKVLLPIDYKV